MNDQEKKDLEDRKNAIEDLRQQSQTEYEKGIIYIGAGAIALIIAYNNLNCFLRSAILCFTVTVSVKLIADFIIKIWAGSLYTQISSSINNDIYKNYSCKFTWLNRTSRLASLINIATLIGGIVLSIMGVLYGQEPDKI